MKAISVSWRLSFILIFVFSFIFGTEEIYAQNSPSSKNTTAVTDSVELAIIPALAYNSDWGVVGGGILSRYSFRDDLKPFHSYFTVFALASTNGLFSSSAFFDKPYAFGKDQRLSIDIYFSRFLQNQYYGIGNYGKIDLEPEENPEFYLYESFTSEVVLILRKPLAEFNNRSNLDLFGILNFNYRTPLGENESRLLNLDSPKGIDGARTLSLGSGLIWENRNNEFDPSSGTYSKTGFQFGNKIIGSGYNYLILEQDFRTYTSFRLLKRITFANRLYVSHTSGDRPYWKLAELGGEETMRGYPENRFLDDNLILLNSEFRSWLFEFPAYDIKLGITLFTDIGRTFNNSAALTDVFNDLKYTFGLGGNSSFFNENFILRGDVGFSEEGFGIYFTSGYLF